MKHYLKYNYCKNNGMVITKITEIFSRQIDEYAFPTRNIFDIEVFDSDMLPKEFSSYEGRDSLNKNFYNLVTNVQKFMVGKYLPFEKCKLGRMLTKHDIASGQKWGMTGFCVNDEQCVMVGPETIVISPSSIRVESEQA